MLITIAIGVLLAVWLADWAARIDEIAAASPADEDEYMTPEEYIRVEDAEQACIASMQQEAGA